MANTHRLTTEETTTLTRAAAAADRKTPLPPEVVFPLVALCERLSYAVDLAEDARDEATKAAGNAIADSTEARAELARRLAPIEAHASLPVETRRLWRQAAETTLAHVQAGGENPDPRPVAEALLSALAEVDRLLLLVLQLDQEATEPPQPPINDAFNSDDTPPDFRAPDAPAAPPAREPFDWSSPRFNTDESAEAQAAGAAVQADGSELSELDTRAASPGAGQL